MIVLVKIDEWLEYAPIFSSGSEFETACSHVDAHLALRTFLVGYSLSIADVSIWSGLAGNAETGIDIFRLSVY